MAEQQIFALPAELTAAVVHALHRQFEQFLQTPGLTAIKFEASQIRRADTAGLQLLHAFVRAADERGLSWELVDVSPVLVRSAKLLGLDAALAIAA